jgi:predicted adenine nucleotide alpha hydrolase (AANH) superfamily ATPase
MKDHFEVTAFFYNPNIYPRAENSMREKEMRRLAEKWGFSVIVAPWESRRWFEAVKGLENEPEGGKRCLVCYRIRLEKTAQLACQKGFDYFGTTLSISPHKKAEVINKIGKDLQAFSGIPFFNTDFKKKDGFYISCRLSEQEGLYRQDYCGCIFSKRESEDRRKGR